jgi:predicted ATPase
LKEKDSEYEANLADMGFGFSQILPILTQIWLLSTARRLRRDVPITVSIEQPELHLHPRLQAKLVDVILSSVRVARQSGVDLRFILETHSETMVNRVGHHVNKGNLRPSEVNVVVFAKQSADEFSDITVSDFAPSGFLENWPYGFFEPEVI